MKRLFTIAFILALGVHSAWAETDRKFINGERSAVRAPLPFSDGVLVGATLYIGGHIGIDPKTDRAAADPRIEAKVVMDRVKGTVEAAGLTMNDVVAMQVSVQISLCTTRSTPSTKITFRTGFPRARFSARALFFAAPTTRCLALPFDGEARDSNSSSATAPLRLPIRSTLGTRELGLRLET